MDVIDKKLVEEFLLSKPEVFLDYPFGEDIGVYKFGSKEDAEMFALIDEKKTPLLLSLKCDPLLAHDLREKYETIMPGINLNKKHWNTIVCTGQVPIEEIYSFIDHAYALVSQ